MTAPVFANPMSAMERMLRALVWNFQQITRANGYSCNIGDILTEVPDITAIKNRPAVALVRGQTVIENTNQSDQEWKKRIPFVAMVYLRSEDPTWDRLHVMQDIEAMLGNNNMLPDEQGAETAREVTLDGDRPFGMVQNTPTVGFAFGFSVRLAQSIFDPSVTC